VGILEDAAQALPSAPPNPAGLELGILRTTGNELVHQGLGASAYLASVHRTEDGRPCPPDLPGEAALCELLAAAAERGLLQSAHDCAEGGLAVALTEIAIACGSGLEAEVPAFGATRADAALFGEVPGRVVVSFKYQNADALASLAQAAGLEFHPIGRLSGSDIIALAWRGEAWLDLDVAVADQLFSGSIDNVMNVATSH
ncbi:MAG TPA: AIR synthase-related protein, partial [Fimbriimonadaceae bacterium]|nr:AIR synthase-related protein [Fimbriimonadaceae bacterium]